MSDHLDTGDVAAGFPKPHEYTVWEDIQGYVLGLVLAALLTASDLVFGDWTSATIFVPRRVWIGEKLLHRLLRCYFRAVLGEHRPQNRQQLYSDAWLIWSAREVNRRPTCLLGPTTTSMLRNLQQQFPIGVQPIVWRLRRLQVL